MQKDDRQIWIDAVRITAGISIVVLHATADPTGQPWVAYSQSERVGPMLLRAVVYTARTELFLIIALFLLLLAHEKTPRTYRQTLAEQSRRLLVPFAFWTLFYAFYGLIKANAFGYYDSVVNDLLNPEKWVGYAILGSVKYHMHFIPTLFGLVLFYPIYRLAIRYPLLGLGVFICLMLRQQVDGYIYQNHWGTEALPYLVRITKIITYIGYGLVAGAALGLWKRAGGKGMGGWFPPVLFAGLVLFLLKLIATQRTIETGVWPFDYLPGYWADFLMPVLLFLGAMSLAHRNWPLVLSRIAPYSFGIYLCHPIFLDLAEIGIHGRGLSPTLQVLVKIGVVLPATGVLVVVLRRSSLFAWTIGLGPLPGYSRAIPAKPEKA